VRETLVLDTNALATRGFGHFLETEYRGKCVLPVVAAAEWFYHVRVQRGWDVPEFSASLQRMRIEIESMHAWHAVTAASLADDTFAANKADWLIGAHALRPGRILVTNNLADHPHVPRKLTPADLMVLHRG
jgi:predicted nucleic acid-binding protein